MVKAKGANLGAVDIPTGRYSDVRRGVGSARRLRGESARSRGFAVFKQRLDFLYLGSYEILWNDNGLMIFVFILRLCFRASP